MKDPNLRWPGHWGRRSKLTEKVESSRFFFFKFLFFKKLPIEQFWILKFNFTKSAKISKNVWSLILSLNLSCALFVSPVLCRSEIIKMKKKRSWWVVQMWEAFVVLLEIICPPITCAPTGNNRIFSPNTFQHHSFSLSQTYDINYGQQCQHVSTHQLKAIDDSERMPRQCEVSEKYRKCLENRRVAGNQKTAWAMQW